MEKDTKHFDRKIEQMMNEHTVAPPFGMWNRIATEVASEALPVAATHTSGVSTSSVNM